MPKLIIRNMTLFIAGVTLAVTAGFALTGQLPVLLAVSVGIAVTISTLVAIK